MRKVWAGLLLGVLAVVAVALAYAIPQIANPPPPTFASAGGTRVTLEVDPGLDAAAAEAAAKADAQVIERRLDSMGWRGAGVRRDGARRLVVDVPGVFDPDRIARIVAARGAFSFRFVEVDPPAGKPKLAPFDPSDAALAVKRRRIVDGSQVVEARPGVDAQTNAAVVNVRLNDAGAKAFGRETAENVGKSMAIVLDDKILMAPRILNPITEGSVQISGNFTVAQVREIATLLGAGSLPAPVTVQATEQVTAPR